MIEHAFQCPYCWQGITALLDPSIRFQDYIEDCEVCCQPIRFQLGFEYGQLVSFEVFRT